MKAPLDCLKIKGVQVVPISKLLTVDQILKFRNSDESYCVVLSCNSGYLIVLAESFNQ